jgi:crotonobetainyl-CoA:carnitine CoA-transferase CaiB-like acyl-CoA transferase
MDRFADIISAYVLALANTSPTLMAGERPTSSPELTETASDSGQAARGPLSGVRILDFTANMTGPLATMILGDQGADVIKVEPPHGDPLRFIGSSVAGMSAYFSGLNRSKRSLVLDLTKTESRPIVEALVDRSDVVLHNFRRKAEVKLGLDAATLKANRPRLIHASISGYGDNGPYADAPAYDLVIQAMSGFAAQQTDRRTGNPGVVQQGVIDKFTGQSTAQAITAALFEQSRTGVGRVIEIQMLQVAIALLWSDGMMSHSLTAGQGTDMPSSVNSFRLTRATDGFFAFSVVTGAQFARLASMIGLDADEIAGSAEARGKQGGSVVRAAAEFLGTLTTAEAVDLLHSFDIAAAPVVSHEELHQHEQVRATEAIDEFVHPVLGPMRQANPAVRLDDVRAGELRGAPQLGEHRDEILREVAFAATDIERLAGLGVFGQVDQKVVVSAK